MKETVAVGLLVGIVGPASAQFFNFGGPPQRQQPSSGAFGGGGGWFGGDVFAPFHQPIPRQQVPRRQAPRQILEDLPALAVDALTARTLIKGEPLAPPAGRADDFAWPRREVGYEKVHGETPTASVLPDGSNSVPATAPKPKKSLQTKQRRPVDIGRSASAPGFFMR